jgi:hypothetical protein
MNGVKQSKCRGYYSIARKHEYVNPATCLCYTCHIRTGLILSPPPSQYYGQQQKKKKASLIFRQICRNHQDGYKRLPSSAPIPYFLTPQARCPSHPLIRTPRPALVQALSPTRPFVRRTLSCCGGTKLDVVQYRHQGCSRRPHGP